MWALPKLLWWRDEGMLRDGARLAHQADVITANLVGHPVASDTSHALKTGYDLIGLRWPTEVLEKLKATGAVYESYSTAAEIDARNDARGRARQLGYDNFDRDLTDSTHREHLRTMLGDMVVAFLTSPTPS